MDQHLLQGWHADPFGRYEQRYFSAGRPTKLVRDGRTEAYDEPPARESPNGAGGAASVPADDDGGADAGFSESATWRQVARVSLDGALGNPTAPYRGASARSRRTGLVNTVVALVAVLAVVAFVLIEGGFSPKHRPTSHGGSAAQGVLAAFVTKSAEQTLARKTADVSLTATADIGSSQVSLRGNGQVDLAANTSDFTLSASYSGATFAESEVITARAVYIELTTNGQSLAHYLGGKHWVEIPVGTSAARNSTPQGSPSWSLQLLEQKGATVTPIAPRTVGQLTCKGYEVTPSRQAMIAAAQREWAEQGLSRSEMAAARQVLENSTPPTITVWMDPTRKLTCQLDIAMQMGTGTSAGSGSAPATESIQLMLTFTHYGVPVDITPPPASDTFSAHSEGTSQLG